MRNICFAWILVALGLPWPASAQLPQAQAVLQDCLRQSAEQNWSITENWAWAQICHRRPVAFARPKNASDHSGNTLGADFMQGIFGNPDLARYALINPLQFSEAYFPSAEIAGGTLPDLSIENASIGKDFTLTGLHISRGLVLKNVKAGGVLALRDVIAGISEITNAEVGAISVSGSKFEKLSVSGGHAGDSIKMENLDVNRRLELTNVEAAAVSLSYVKSDVMAIVGTKTAMFGIDHATAGRVGLWAMVWQGAKSRLELHDITATRFDWKYSDKRFAGDRPDMPAEIKLSDIAAGSIYVGGDPVGVMQLIAPSIDQAGLAPALYSKLAKTYTDRGQPELARQIDYLKENDSYQQDRFLPWPLHKTVTLLMWVFFGYGLYPEVGMIWIGILVLIASQLLKSGSARLVEGTAPANWLLFTADAVLPGINLDPDHKDIRFQGWRQYLLYGVRLLGAAVLFIFVRLLQQAAGPGGVS